MGMMSSGEELTIKLFGVSEVNGKGTDSQMHI
jgi:hypothetical protein